ncbi:probable multidrug resistance-associated protein lethal(2)03659 [Phlebotomus argentipes]|uniref:probable multidrug resistance-associated protein lethal(2)03659 n=1 Tax=Phlebotomus argentipes TaxID=94469 RepID=UPI00289336B3|nr:probable multidrug resistance-associated protein lethal(2)03659 [Phlebotomus argentipes]
MDKNLPNNPRENANFLSRITFFWMINLFKLGYRKSLELRDLYKPLVDDRSAVLGDRLEEKWQDQLRSAPARPSLIKAIAITFWREYVCLGLIVVTNDFVIRLGQPLLLRRLLLYFRNDSNISHTEAIVCAIGIITLNGLGVFTSNHITFCGCHNGMKVRVAVCSLVYRKALRLSRAALGNVAPGKVVNLLSNDVNRFDMVSVFVNWLWSAPLLALTIGYILYELVGVPALIGIAIVLIVMPLQSFTGRLASKYRLQTALKTDERVRFIDEVISGVQVIKMYAWEKPIETLITTARKFELSVIRKCANLRGIYMAFSLFTTRLALFGAMVAMTLLKYEMTAARIFMISAYYNILGHTMSQMFVRGVAEVSEAMVSFKRLQQFLELEEHIPQCIDYQQKMEETDSLLHKFPVQRKNEELLIANNLSISMKNVRCRWENSIKFINNEKILFNNKNQPNLADINLDIKTGTLVGVIGPVGSGKSSLIEALLHELPPESGSIAINGRVLYVSQNSWIFAATLQQNILFGQPMRHARYQQTLSACALNDDLKQFPQGDRTIIGERGSSLSGGQKARVNLARAVYQEADIYLLDDPLSAVDAHVGRQLYDEVIGPKGLLRHSTRVLVTHQIHFLKEADWIIELKEGRIRRQGSPSIILENTEETVSSENTKNEKTTREVNGILDIQNTDKLPSLELEKTSEGVIDGSIILQYLRSGASICVLLVIVMLFLQTQIIASASDYIVAIWTHQGEFHEPTNYYLILNGCLVGSIFLLAIIRSIGFYEICIKASQELHNCMLKGVIGATMHFFETNPSGRILNRFSRDLGSVDELLPKVLLDASQMILSICGAILVTATVNPLFLIPIAFLGIVFITVRQWYLKSSRNIKRLDGITRSPVFTHLAASLSGLSTIRAFGTENRLVDEFDSLQDVHSSAWYLFICCTSAFGQVLDFLSVIFVAIVTFTFLIVDNQMIGDKVGLAITQSLTLTGLLGWGIRQTAATSNALMSVERLLEYKQLEPEPEPVIPLKLTKFWPLCGEIIFDTVFLKYHKNSDPVLKGISFRVAPREKVGVVGRTGAGKTSLISALFRMATVEGKIMIDGIDISYLSLNDLRSHLSIIPQDPVLFSGTLRSNLDPFGEYSDDDLWQALNEVELKSIASDKSGLDMPVKAGGNNFSVGQRQLICLARALLRNNRILVLDEATANVDPRTDALIQRTIKERFKNCTVLTIAHRLNTIMDSNRVLVISNGIIAEFASPDDLLQDPNSIFSKLHNNC